MIKILSCIWFLLLLFIGVCFGWALHIAITTYNLPLSWDDRYYFPLGYATAGTFMYEWVDNILKNKEEEVLNYLTVVQLSDGKCYLELVKNDEDKAYYVSSHLNLDASIKRFSSFYDKALYTDYTWHVSSCYGIMQISPHIIKVPKGKEGEWVEQFVVNPKPVAITGGNFSINKDVRFIEVEPKILEHSVLDIAKDVINSTYAARE